MRTAVGLAETSSRTRAMASSARSSASRTCWPDVVGEDWQTLAQGGERADGLIAQCLVQRAQVEGREWLGRECRVVDGGECPMQLCRALAKQLGHAQVRADRLTREI